MRTIKFLGAARADLRAEQRHYLAISPLLAAKFVRAVNQAVNFIAEHPFAMQPLGHEIRRWPVDGFPHGVFYRVGKAEILVLAIFHPKQDPQRWQQRS